MMVGGRSQVGIIASGFGASGWGVISLGEQCMEQLRRELARIDGKSYGAYKDIKGQYRFDGFTLTIDHVQGDPFAAPSRIRVQVDAAGFPESLWQTPVRRTALCDYLARALRDAIKAVNGQRHGGGSGKSGDMAVCPLTQQVLRRSTILINAAGVEARMTVGLPGRGRTILGREAVDMLTQRLPQAVDRALRYANLDAYAVAAHVNSVEDQNVLRDWLKTHGKVAFIAEGAVLPRLSGIDERPLQGGQRFCPPNALLATLELPHRGTVRGMAIPEGVTLIVGGGFHGKSTVLNAIEMGVYDHIPGDGRERVVTRQNAVKVRAEDGRAVNRVDIRPFIDNLPFGRDSADFCTQNASGSTSQAAAIIEAMQTGTSLLLMDEDTCATNFMIRDRRMQQLVAKDKEPITPFLHRVRQLYDDHEVSSIIVMGGSGDYFQVADTVIMMDAYLPKDVTAEAKKLAGDDLPTEALAPMALAVRPALVAPDPSRGKRSVSIDAQGRAVLGDVVLRYGEQRVDLSRVAQIADVAQVRAIGHLIHRWHTRHMDAPDPIAGLKAALAEAEDDLDVLSPWPVGDLALPRLQELAAALGRMRQAGPKINRRQDGYGV
jgi:predicted ABC-class ATPase